MWENCEQRAFFCFFFQMCNCGCTQTGNREASRPVGSRGVVRTDRPLSTSPSPPPACFLIPPSASFWGWSHCVETSLPTCSHKLPPPPPTSSSCLISMQPGRWYSNNVQRYDLINGIWLPARIPETSMAFWKSEGWDGREEGVLGGRRCLASRGRVLPIRLWKRHFPLTPEDERGCDRVLHLTQREGGGRRGANKHGMSNCLWTNLFSLWLAGRPAHLCDTELCVNAAIWGEVLVDGSASAKWVESWSQIKTDQAHTPPGPLTDINLVYGEERRARVSIFCFNCYFKVTDELRLTQSLKLKKKWFARRCRETKCLKPFQTPTQQR